MVEQPALCLVGKRKRISTQKGQDALAQIREFWVQCGEDGTLAALRGKPVLVNLWATWCAPCLAELPTLNRLATEVEGRAHVVALAQDVNATHATTRGFLTQRGWETIESWSDPENRVGLEEGGELPTTILYDASGMETARVVGPLDWYSPEARELLRAAGFPRVE